MNLLQRFHDFVKDNNLFQPKDKLLLAVSGGVDSVVLCELCKQADYDFSIAHCNFQLRGVESDRDENFVRSLGEKYGVEIWVKKFYTEKYAGETKKGIQEAARDLRYEWFDELIGKDHKFEIRNPKSEIPNPKSQIRNPKFILTAHHADDNIETVLMNFCRGTGLHGLEGIPMDPLHIRRPLLGFWKHELREFAQENKLKFVEDYSNLSSKYTRNLFRNEIIPLIEKVYPQLKSNLQDNINRFKDIGLLYDISVAAFKKKLCKSENGEILIPVKQLVLYQSRALIFEIIREYGFTEKQVDEVIKLAATGSGKYIENEMYQIIRHRNWFIIAPRSGRTDTTIIEKNSEPVRSHAGVFHLKIISKEKFVPDKSAKIAQLDIKNIEFPLLLRKWKQGDYFYPLGMRKKKKLSRFFIDQKLAKNQKENVWVIESAKKIIWVVGLRVDDRFKITDKTKEVLKISLETS